MYIGYIKNNLKRQKKSKAQTKTKKNIKGVIYTKLAKEDK